MKTIKNIRSNWPAKILLSLSMLVFNACEKDSATPPPPPETSTVTDIEGNVYVAVKIGNQWWMAEDLRTATFRDGTPITQMQQEAGWYSTTPHWCIYDNSAQAPGYLYNWYAVNASNQIAPAGWRIPTDADWKELEKYLGMTQEIADKSSWRGADEGNKLKASGRTGWVAYGSNWPINESGFTAKGGGCRLWNGVWGNPGINSTAFYWSITEHPGEEAWYRHLDYKRNDIFRYHGLKTQGFAIRCIKEN